MCSLLKYKPDLLKKKKNKNKKSSQKGAALRGILNKQLQARQEPNSTLKKSNVFRGLCSFVGVGGGLFSEF
jgi:hypothetical protein